MRTKTISRWRRAALAGAMALSLAGRAQDAEQPPSKPETAPVITEQSPRPPPDTDIKPVPGTPEEYTITKGDTLWDLSQKFLNNPWYWPKIWSLNPSIENPHWIYPGNKLRIVPGPGGQGVIQIEQGQAAAGGGQPQQPAEAEEEEPQEPADLAIV